MPTLIECPGCNEPIPLTEATRATPVECPYCEQEFTAFAELGSAPAPAPTAKPKAKSRRRDDEDDEEDEDEDGVKRSKRGAGGSAIMVIVVGGLGLLGVMAGLGLTTWLIFTYDPNDSADTNTGRTSTSNTPNNPNRPGPNRPGPPNVPDPGPGFTPPKSKPNGFDLRPVNGPAEVLQPPQWLPATGPKEVALPGKVAKLAVGGRGRFLVLHFPDLGQLSVFDLNSGTLSATITIGRGEAHVAAGASRVVTGADRTFRVYSLPDLGLLATFTPTGDEMAFPVSGLAMGSNTDGPVLVNDVFGKVRLLDISGTPKFVPGATDEPGVPAGTVRASADGKMFVVGHDQEVMVLIEKNRKWTVTARILAVPAVPGPDGRHVFCAGQIVNGEDGRVVVQKQAGSPPIWLVPAVHGNYFLRVTATPPASPGPKAKQALTLAICAGRDPSRTVGPVGTLDETDKLVEWWGQDPKPAGPFDQYLFLIPDARTLLVIPVTRDRIVARHIDFK